jgi:HD-GYP domain-containing protein (c-di-GMP phosphodiesterase class II)
MLSHRPRRAALSLDAALSEIENNQCKLYDAQVVGACTALFRERDFNFSV